MITFPKDTPQFSWTRHIKNKMVFYHLSGAQILRIFRKPARREEGIAPGTFACMQAKVANRVTRNAKRESEKPLNDTRYTLHATQKRAHEEIWIMYKVAQRETRNAKRKVTESSNDTRYAPCATRPSRITLISAWRYPGVTKPGERPQIPEDVAEMLEKGIY